MEGVRPALRALAFVICAVAVIAGATTLWLNHHGYSATPGGVVIPPIVAWLLVVRSRSADGSRVGTWLMLGIGIATIALQLIALALLTKSPHFR